MLSTVPISKIKKRLRSAGRCLLSFLRLEQHCTCTTVIAAFRFYCENTGWVFVPATVRLNFFFFFFFFDQYPGISIFFFLKLDFPLPLSICRLASWPRRWLRPPVRAGPDAAAAPLAAEQRTFPACCLAPAAAAAISRHHHRPPGPVSPGLANPDRRLRRRGLPKIFPVCQSGPGDQRPRQLPCHRHRRGLINRLLWLGRQRLWRSLWRPNRPNRRPRGLILLTVIAGMITPV